MVKLKLMIVDDVIMGQSHEAGESCAVCGKSVAGAGGYTRIKHGESMVALCCPLCLETFQKNPKEWVHRKETSQEARAIFDLLRPKPSAT
jgi:hypothetical protein